MKFYHAHNKLAFACIDFSDRINSITESLVGDMTFSGSDLPAPTVPFDNKLFLAPDPHPDPVVSRKNLMLQGKQLFVDLSLIHI